MTPAEELQAAAALLRTTLVSAATDGPWYATEYDVYTQNTYDFEAGLGASPGQVDIAGHGYEGGGFARLCDAQYAAAMHPGVGAALARMLEQAADALVGQDVPADEPALAVARQILGSQP
ncbi:hypothetical protein [Streptomyces lavendulae]|uniref:hypothetical protein n=1 Tax=Streptomyces lavendulae TaxID=1914 RepID=UPI0031EE8FFF